MPTTNRKQYTVRGIPHELDRALRRKARRRGVSLNQLLVEELSAIGGGLRPARFRNLGDLGGVWEDDRESDRILGEQRQIDPELWK